MALLSNRKSHVMDARASSREKREHMLLTLQTVIKMRDDGRPGVSRQDIMVLLPQFSEFRTRSYLLGLVELGCLTCQQGLNYSQSLEERRNTYFLLPFALAKFVDEMPEQAIPESHGKVEARKRFKAEFCGPMLPFTRRDYRNMTRRAEIAALPEDQKIKMVPGAPLVVRNEPIKTTRLRDHYTLPTPCQLMSLFYKKELSACA